MQVCAALYPACMGSCPRSTKSAACRLYAPPDWRPYGHSSPSYLLQLQAKRSTEHSLYHGQNPWMAHWKNSLCNQTMPEDISHDLSIAGKWARTLSAGSVGPTTRGDTVFRDYMESASKRRQPWRLRHDVEPVDVCSSSLESVLFLFRVPRNLGSLGNSS